MTNLGHGGRGNRRLSTMAFVSRTLLVAATGGVLLWSFFLNLLSAERAILAFLPSSLPSSLHASITQDDLYNLLDQGVLSYFAVAESTELPGATSAAAGAIIGDNDNDNEDDSENDKGDTGAAQSGGESNSVNRIKAFPSTLTESTFASNTTTLASDRSTTDLSTVTNATTNKERMRQVTFSQGIDILPPHLKIKPPVFIASVFKSGTTSADRYFRCGRLGTTHTRHRLCAMQKYKVSCVPDESGRHVLGQPSIGNSVGCF
jgi:hypothetical protein